MIKNGPSLWGWAGSFLYLMGIWSERRERGIKLPQCHENVAFTEHHWWFDLDHIVQRPIRAQQHAAVTHCIDQLMGLLGCRLLRRAIVDQFNAKEKPLAADVANEFVLLLKRLESTEEHVAHQFGVGLKVFMSDDVKHGQSAGTGHGISTKGGEELHAIVECVGDRSGRDDRSHGVPIADGLAEDHDVRDDIVKLEAPHGLAKAAESNLHFISNAEAASLSYMLVRCLEVAGRQGDLPAA